MNQVVRTDKGDFLDNAVGKLDGKFGIVPHGYDWKCEIGKEISGFSIVYDRGYPWIKKETKR